MKTHIHIFIAKLEGNTRDSYSPHFCHVIIATIYNCHLPLSALFPLLSTSTSADCNSLSGEITQTFIPEESRPLVILPNFSLTLITGHDNTKRDPKGSSLFCIFSSFLPLDSWICEFWLWEKRHHILDADSEHIHHSGEPCPRPLRYLVFKRLFHHSVRSAASEC